MLPRTHNVTFPRVRVLAASLRSAPKLALAENDTLCVLGA